LGLIEALEVLSRKYNTPAARRPAWMPQDNPLLATAAYCRQKWANRIETMRTHATLNALCVSDSLEENRLWRFRLETRMQLRNLLERGIRRSKTPNASEWNSPGIESRIGVAPILVISLTLSS